MSWNGERKIDIKASNPAWNKWLPSWPTSRALVRQGRFRRYMAAHIAHRGDITVREFISEFRGMTATAKQKVVLAETGASHVSLHHFFGLQKANTDNIAKLLASFKRHSKPVRPPELGIIGKEHFYRLMEAAGGDPKTFTYNRSLGETGGRSPRRRICIRYSSRRSRALRAVPEPQSHHRRQLVARQSTIRSGNSGAAAKDSTASWRRSAPTPRSRSSPCCTWLVRGSRTPIAASRRSSWEGEDEWRISATDRGHGRRHHRRYS